MINKHKSNKIKENSNTVRHLNNGTDHRHSKSCCDQSSPARRTITLTNLGLVRYNYIRAIIGSGSGVSPTWCQWRQSLNQRCDTVNWTRKFQNLVQITKLLFWENAFEKYRQGLFPGVVEQRRAVWVVLRLKWLPICVVLGGAWNSLIGAPEIWVRCSSQTRRNHAVRGGGWWNVE